MEDIKNEKEIYEATKNFIDYIATKQELKDMLIQCIDNYDNSIYKDLYTNFIEKNK